MTFDPKFDFERVFSACCGSVSKTIIHVMNSSVVHSNRDSSFESRTSFSSFFDQKVEEPISSLTERRTSNTKTEKCEEARARRNKPSHRSITQECSGKLETNPERTREQPRGTAHATRPGLHREWPIWDVDIGNALSATRQYTRGNASEERARRLRKTLLALLAPQGKALLEDLNPSRRCGRAKHKVN